MTLAFSTHIKKKPTYFIEKINNALIEYGIASIEVINAFERQYSAKFGFHLKEVRNSKKIHSIREDSKDRWEKGKNIHFVVNNRTKNRFQFAPVVPVTSTQEVFMTYAYNDLIQISIDGQELFGYEERLAFAKNDGFDTWEDFFNWFYPLIMAHPEKHFKGKIIHWTNHTY